MPALAWWEGEGHKRGQLVGLLSLINTIPSLYIYFLYITTRFTSRFRPNHTASNTRLIRTSTSNTMSRSRYTYLRPRDRTMTPAYKPHRQFRPGQEQIRQPHLRPKQPPEGSKDFVNSEHTNYDDDGAELDQGYDQAHGHEPEDSSDDEPLAQVLKRQRAYVEAHPVKTKTQPRKSKINRKPAQTSRRAGKAAAKKIPLPPPPKQKKAQRMKRLKVSRVTSSVCHCFITNPAQQPTTTS